ncbi:hypothetical protein LC612_30355, partial [Nostoc sp. CHAB 5834]|nr:hypothetical protein [Nostoc sp. CHAB 5834]
YSKAHHCFSRIFLQFPAAAYMQVFTLDKIGRTAEMATKINRIRQWEISRPVNGFLRGFLTHTLKVDAVDFAGPIHAFALYQELIEAVQLVREEHDEPFNAPAFWEAFTLSPTDFHQIQHWVLEKELVDLLEEKRTLFSTEYNESEQLGWGADPEAIFKRLQTTSSQMEESLVLLIGEWQLRTQVYHFYIRYFYFNQSLTLWQTFSLLMYLEKRRLNNRSTPNLTKEVGSKTAEEFIKQLMQDPATYVTAGAFSISSTTAVAIETTALAGTAIFIILKVLQEFTPSESLGGDEAQSEYKRFKINLLERLYDTGEELNLDSKTLFDKFIKPVLEKELGTDT